MTETVWLLFALWLILLIVGFKRRGLVSYVSVIIGLFFGLTLVNNVGLVVGVSIIFLNLGLLWQVITEEAK